MKYEIRRRSPFPRYVQQIFLETAAKWPGWQVETDKIRLKKFAGIMKKKGVKFGTMSAKERLRWANTLPNIAQEWAKRQDKKGLPGSAVLAAYMSEAIECRLLFHFYSICVQKQIQN